MLPEFHTIFTINYQVAFKIFFGTKLLFQSGAERYFKVGHLRQPFISKWGKRYFKVGQRQLFQSESMFISKWGKRYFKVGQLLQSGAKCHFTVGQLFQSGTIISK